MLDPAEARRVADTFGAAHERIRQDHLLSHLLAALSREVAEVLIFFGGTALARTHLPAGRLSEDIDLVAIGARREIVGAVEAALVRGARREYGVLTWDPPLSAVRDVEPATLHSTDGLVVRVQLLDPAGLPSWPTEVRDLVQRYSDPPPSRLRTLTLPAFAAAKTSAWLDRHAPRDLYDLWGLSHVGAMTHDAAQLFARFGGAATVPRRWMFDDAPAEREWEAQLAAQTKIAITAADALAEVRRAWSSVSDTT
jgi:predicted nucleotidyltransferase component of viral defense system